MKVDLGSNISLAVPKKAQEEDKTLATKEDVHVSPC